MSVVFIFFAAPLIWLSYKSFRGGLEYLAFFKQELQTQCSDFAPFATVFVPCRGVDEGLEDNLRSFTSQNYPVFEIIFIVDDARDPAVHFIKKFLRANAHLIVAPKAIRSSQKVENLRYAVQQADKRSKIFAFADSDVFPDLNWLRNLIAPLKDPGVGASTGYRWYISRRSAVASELRSVWNASIASALGPRTRSNFCWGGSMAISRQKFEELEIGQRWAGALSDDFTVTRVINEAGSPIVFVPQALSVSQGECTLLEMLEFTTRQMKITRVYAPHLWITALLGSMLFVGVMLSSSVIVLFSDRVILKVLAAITLLVVSIFSIGKAWLRLQAVHLVLPAHKHELRRQTLSQLTLWSLTPLVFLYNCVRALFSRRIVWRGTTYELKSPTETVIIPD